MQMAKVLVGDLCMLVWIFVVDIWKMTFAFFLYGKCSKNLEQQIHNLKERKKIFVSNYM